MLGSHNRSYHYQSVYLKYIVNTQFCITKRKTRDLSTSTYCWMSLSVFHSTPHTENRLLLISPPLWLPPPRHPLRWLDQIFPAFSSLFHVSSKRSPPQAKISHVKALDYTDDVICLQYGFRHAAEITPPLRGSQGNRFIMVS